VRIFFEKSVYGVGEFTIFSRKRVRFFGENRKEGEITFFVFDYVYKGKIRASEASEKPDRNFWLQFLVEKKSSLTLGKKKLFQLFLA